GSWQFVTEAPTAIHRLAFDLDAAARPVHWQGGFFTGFCGVSFGTDAKYRIPTFEKMAEVRRSAPRAWSLQRDFWLTGAEHQPGQIEVDLPNLVRERETRRITAIEAAPDGATLRVEDFFGHEQYGIESGRPV